MPGDGVDKEALKAKMAASKAKLAKLKLAQKRKALAAKVAAKLAAAKAADTASGAAPASGTAPDATPPPAAATAPPRTSSTAAPTRALAPSQTPAAEFVGEPSLPRGRAATRGRRRAFRFLPKGALTARLRRQREAAAAAATETGETDKRFDDFHVVGEGAGAVEWWDADIGPNTLDNLVEHPVPIPPPVVGAGAGATKVRMTARERQKLRKRKRKELEEERQVRIRLGLEKPPPPKVKLSNMMRVLGIEAVADPSAVEARVRAETNARIQAHLDRNAAAALTPEQRKAKEKAKRMEDTSQHVAVAVFRVEYLDAVAWRASIAANAKHYNLTGTVLTGPYAVVVVEGGPKGIGKFTRWMTQKVKWTDVTLVAHDVAKRAEKRAAQRAAGVPDLELEAAETNLNEASIAANACSLIWLGWVRRRAFSAFTFEKGGTLASGRAFLKFKNCEHYLDVAARVGPSS
ncbi:uncharacterized protein AMSG_00434 [Thecamonas trahens ATCC 50062]|uniref:Uncharacterized protein n=1 Tax=Thecamonas trahens ATCC 50062 TaxID=461836 RepID=A0A0L0D9D1_THETB|nr:hypothetical protein AMSG_00434 [Thecamonas trahens ATCC 50062]KNC48656.1 hypothetical protein AMSG_00434 [Thecamonas trahens ATCC 50062]|eukprot:XP_013762712.1 hypothetical protein AMSG_00434 [Thecamonas trahens ATCC 50062]